MKYVLYTVITVVMTFNLVFWPKVACDTYQLLEIQEELKVGLMAGHKTLHQETLDYPKWILPTRIHGLYHRLRDEVGVTINNLEATRQDPDEHCEDEGEPIKEPVKIGNNKPKKELKMLDPPKINF